MDPLPLNAVKNKQTSILTGLRRKVANVKTICDDPEVLQLDKLSTASDRLEKAWRKYEKSQQEVLGFFLEDEVANEQITFTEKEESYEAAIDKAKKIIRVELKAEDERNLQPEQALQLTLQRGNLQKQVRETLDYVKEEEKEEVTTSRSSLKVQRDALLDAKDRLREAKELTRE